MELDPYLAGAAFLVPSQLVVSGKAIPSKPLDMVGGPSIEIFAENLRTFSPIILKCALKFDAGAWARLVHGHDPDEHMN